VRDCRPSGEGSVNLGAGSDKKGELAPVKRFVDFIRVQQAARGGQFLHRLKPTLPNQRVGGLAGGIREEAPTLGHLGVFPLKADKFLLQLEEFLLVRLAVFLNKDQFEHVESSHSVSVK